MLSDDMLPVIIVDDGVVAESGRSNRLRMLQEFGSKKRMRYRRKTGADVYFCLMV